MDRKNVIRNLETVYQLVTVDVKFSHGLTGNDYEKIAGWVSDGIAMLKEQEAVEPIPPTDQSDLWKCGNCNHQLFRFTHQRYCEMCGRSVKWD